MAHSPMLSPAALRVYVIAALTFAIGAPPATAAVTLGSDLTSPATASLACEAGSDCTLVPTALPGRLLAAPSDGVVVRWRIRADGTLYRPGKLHVIRPGPGGTYTDVTPADRQPFMSASEGIAMEAVRLPIKQGDLLGLAPATGEIPATERLLVDAAMMTFAWPFQGAARLPDAISPVDLELLFNADVEPDVDGDGYGDETQDHCPRVADLPRGRCAGLLVTASPSSEQLLIGREARYEVVVRSLGTRADGVHVIAGLPPALVSGPLPGNCQAVAERQVECDLGTSASLGNPLSVEIGVHAVARVPMTDGMPGWAVPTLTVRSSSTPLGVQPEPGWVQPLQILAPGRCANAWLAKPEGSRFDATAQGDDMRGDHGRDNFQGNAGDDCLSGGPGDDDLDGGRGVDRLDGGPGTDLLSGGPGNDRLMGSSGRDRLLGDGGRDRLLGGAGRDTIDARDRRADLVSCGGGRDRARVDAVDRVSGCEVVLRPKRK